MSNWYKQSQHITTFDERNRANARIHHLEKLSETLRYTADLVYMTQRGARSIVQKMLLDKRLSSFPDVIEFLAKADRAAMDSPRRFAEFVLKGASEMDRKVVRLKADRKNATKAGLPRKGLY